MKEKISKNPEIMVGMNRRIEVWRPINKLTPAQMKDAKAFGIFGGVEKALIDVDEHDIDFKDLITDVGLNALCGQSFDVSGNRPAVFNYVAIGEGVADPANDDTVLGTESYREVGTYAKDGPTGECSMDAEFSIDATKALTECGLFNAAETGTLYCRDTYDVKNVVSGDTVKVYYTPKFQRPA